MSRDRDRILEQALKLELRAADTAVTGACLDAETLAAWADDGLDGAAMQAAEAHVSTCARCQAMVAAFTRGASPSTLAPLEPTPPLAPEAPGPLAWWKWLAPLAAGAAAVTLWMVLPAQQQVALAPPPTADSPRAPAPPTAADPARSATAPPPAAARARQAPLDNIAAGAREDRQQLRDEAKQEKAITLAEADATRRDTAASSAPPAPAAPAAAPAPAPPREAGAAMLRKAFTPLEVISPDPARRWRVAGNAIERSEDAGASWTPLRATNGETITAGTSPAASICWLVGTNGLVLVTVDGISFARVPLSEAVDLTSIAAADARAATVTTADGRRFRTDDSGRTWRAF